MKCLVTILILFASVVYSQSSVDVGTGASIDLGTGTNLDVDSHSGTFTGDGTINNSPLPVELTDFTAAAIDNSVELKWETATEVNNFGFEILRSAQSDTVWSNIGFVQGHGTVNSPKEYSFTDSNLPDADEVSYRLKQIDNDGAFAYSKIVTVDLSTITDVDDEVIYEFALEQNYPNPFNPSTTISFTVSSNVKSETSNTKLIVYNILGKEVATLVNQKLQPGNHLVSFDASSLSSGIYFYRLQTDRRTDIKKMILVK